MAKITLRRPIIKKYKTPMTVSVGYAESGQCLSGPGYGLPCPVKQAAKQLRIILLFHCSILSYLAKQN